MLVNLGPMTTEADSFKVSMNGPRSGSRSAALPGLPTGLCACKESGLERPQTE